MAVTTIFRPRARVRHVAPMLPPTVLLLMLLAPAFDLLGLLLPRIQLAPLALAAALIGGVTVLIAWVRFPRTSWLLAATLAAAASIALRLAGADIAPSLSLLVVLALGVGGAFASPVRELDAPWVEPQPNVARR